MSEYNYPIINLDACQMGSGNAAGLLRHEASTNAGDYNTRGLAQCQSLKIHTQGALGEVAFYLGLGELLDAPYAITVNEQGKPDFSVNHHPGDVKTSRWPNLLVPERHYHADYVYVAVQQIAPDRYSLNGWITGAEMAAKFTLEDPDGRGKRFLVKKADLRPFKKFSEEIIDRKT